MQRELDGLKQSSDESIAKAARAANRVLTGNLKQLVIEWCEHHPAFAGLAESAWCTRMRDNEQQAPPGRRLPMVYKFCLECTP